MIKKKSWTDGEYNSLPAYIFAPQLVASVHHRELGTGRWVNLAINWTRGITRLLVEVEIGSPSTEFIPFGHISGGCANQRMQ